MSTVPTTAASAITLTDGLIAKLKPELEIDTSVLAHAIALSKFNAEEIPPADIVALSEKIELFKANLNSRMADVVASIKTACKTALETGAAKDEYNSLLEMTTYLTTTEGIALSTDENLTSILRSQSFLRDTVASFMIESRDLMEQLTCTIAHFASLEEMPTTANQTLYGYLSALDEKYPQLNLKNGVLESFYHESRALWVAAGSPAGQEPGGDNWSAINLFKNPDLLITLIERRVGGSDGGETSIGNFQTKLFNEEITTRAQLETAITEVTRTLPYFTQDAIFGTIWADNDCSGTDARDWIFTGGDAGTSFREEEFFAAVNSVLKKYTEEELALSADIRAGLDYDMWEEVYLTAISQTLPSFSTAFGELEYLVKENKVANRADLEKAINNAKIDLGTFSDDEIFGKIWADNDCGEVDARDWVFTGGEEGNKFRQEPFLKAFIQVVAKKIEDLPVELILTIDLTADGGIEDAIQKYKAYNEKTLETKKAFSATLPAGGHFQLDLAAPSDEKEPFASNGALGLLYTTMTPGYYNNGDDYRFSTPIAMIRLPESSRRNLPVKLQEMLTREGVQLLDVNINVMSTTADIYIDKEDNLHMNANILEASDRKLNFAPHGWAQPKAKKGTDTTKRLKMGIYSPSGMEETGDEGESHGSGLRMDRVTKQDNHVHPSDDGVSVCASPDNGIVKMSDGAAISSGYSVVLLEEGGVKKALVTYHWIFNDKEAKRVALAAEIKKATTAKDFLVKIDSVDDSGLSIAQKDQMRSLLTSCPLAD